MPKPKHTERLCYCRTFDLAAHDVPVPHQVIYDGSGFIHTVDYCPERSLHHLKEMEEQNEKIQTLLVELGTMFR